MNILHIDKKLCRARSLLQERSNVQESLHTLLCSLAHYILVSDNDMASSQ